MAAAKYVVIAIVGCGGAAHAPSEVPAVKPAATPVPTSSCLADAPTELVLDYSVPAQCSVPDLRCRSQCMEGDGGACMARAYAVEAEPATKSEASPLFERACQLGLAIGCTNYGAWIWGGGGSRDDLPCAQRLFTKACGAHEKFACGMIGRLLYEGAKTPEDYARARENLEQSCEAAQGFPCRVLAKYLEEGKLGSYSPTRISELLARACEGGDKNACGSHATASETFH